MDPVSFAPPILFIAAIVWAIVQVLKQIVPLEPRALALVCAVVLGVLGYTMGYLTGNPFELVGQVLLATLGASALHNYGYHDRVGGSSDAGGGK